MKKVIGLIILSTLMFVLVGCQSRTKDTVSKDISIESNDTSGEDNKAALTVEIIANNDSNSYKGLPIILKSKIEGKSEKVLQYHWILENNTDFEGFVISEKGPQKEIVNSGEPVELGVFAEVNYIEGALNKFKVKLQVEDKETSDIIATDEIIIENKVGYYSIKQ